MGIIISCSDWTDVAQAEVEIAALKYAPPDTRFISVPVTPFSALNCAFNVRLIAEALSCESVILASADPRAAGISREPIVVKFKKPDIHLVCPNIGIATLLLERYEPVMSIRLEYDEWATSIFNGRDLYAPVAGRIAAGCKISELGQEFPLSSIHRLQIKYGTVLHIDNYGNIKLYAGENLAGTEHILVNGQKLRVAKNHMLRSGEIVPAGELIVTNGSSFGLIELQVKADREGSIGAAELLGLSVGDIVDLTIV